MKRLSLALTAFLMCGCTVSLSCFVEQDWKNDPRSPADPRSKARIQVELRKELGRDTITVFKTTRG